MKNYFHLLAACQEKPKVDILLLFVSNICDGILFEHIFYLLLLIVENVILNNVYHRLDRKSDIISRMYK